MFINKQNKSLKKNHTKSRKPYNDGLTLIKQVYRLGKKTEAEATKCTNQGRRETK